MIFSEQKLHTHTKKEMRRREPGIIALASRYNKLCIEMETIIKRNEAPKGAVIPLQIERQGIFKLDVDDDIWQDVGLEEEDEYQGNVPDWLGNESVREGIKCLLQLDRCREEKERLIMEMKRMPEWMLEEWECIQEAITISGMCIYQVDE